MKSRLTFIDHKNLTPSDCGDVLDISFSNAGLNWQGVILEKGHSPHFYPQHVHTPYFYFALALEQDLNWSSHTQQGITELKTSPGSIWINPPKTPFSHSISEPCYFVILAIEEHTFLDACPLNLKGQTLQFLNNYNVDDEVIKGIIDLFLLEAQSAGRNGYAYFKNLLSLLATHYIRNYSSFDENLGTRQGQLVFDQARMNTIDAYINNNINTAISIDDLAELLHCSKFYFLREFKKHLGITPYQYLLNLRLEKAKHLLSSPHAQIAHVALELGFNDQSHFTRAFKNHFDITPGQFQKTRKSEVQ